jgi:hypothetical protein
MRSGAGGRRDYAPTPDYTACVLSTLPRGALAMRHIVESR